MKRLAISLTFFLVLSVGVGLAASGPELMDWGIAGGLFAIAVCGEGFRFWIRRSRAAKKRSSQV
ncbi:MAG: hypothetical protein HOV67_35075 [Kribbellaceae bacterium]|nr:hypothetical protein [Kribbellaceae bacterium]